VTEFACLTPVQGHTIRLTSEAGLKDPLGNVCVSEQVVLAIESDTGRLDGIRLVLSPDLAFKLGEAITRHARRITFGE